MLLVFPGIRDCFPAVRSAISPHARVCERTGPPSRKRGEGEHRSVVLGVFVPGRGYSGDRSDPDPDSRRGVQVRLRRGVGGRRVLSRPGFLADGRKDRRRAALVRAVLSRGVRSDRGRVRRVRRFRVHVGLAGLRASPGGWRGHDQYDRVQLHRRIPPEVGVGRSSRLASDLLRDRTGYRAAARGAPAVDFGGGAWFCAACS